jgi:hypothetical protein
MFKVPIKDDASSLMGTCTAISMLAIALTDGTMACLLLTAF